MTTRLVIGRKPGVWLGGWYRVSAALQDRHIAVFGPTGSGKSTQLVSIASQDAALPWRPGFLVIDIKDTLAQEVAVRLPPHRESDALLFDLADRAHPPAFNPLANVPEASRTLAASELISAFKRLWGESWGPRLEHVLRNAALTLLELPNATLLDIIRLLTDAPFRSYAARQVSNFSVRQFWESEFLSIVGTRGSVANVEAILNKLSILSYPEIRNVLGQTSKGLDIAQAMQRGTIILAHLPQGVLGEDASTFMASLLVAHVQLAAQRRVQVAAQFRRPFYLIADECQNYDISSFQKLISEGRSMGVGVVAACQFEEQLSQQLRQTIQHNCIIKLSCGTARGRHTVQVVYLQQDPKGEFPIQLRAYPAKQRPQPDMLTYIQARSRTTLARPRREVEAAIQDRMTGRRTSANGSQSDSPGAGQERSTRDGARFYEN